MTAQAERLLQSLCLFAIVWILGFQTLGLLNLYAAAPAFRSSWIVAAAIFFIAIWLLLDRPFRWFHLPRISDLHASFPLPLAIVGGAYCLFFIERLTGYPSGYDAIAYHLMNPVSWIQTASVRLLDLKWNMSLPANAELFTLPAIALNAQNLVFPGNLVATGILALAVYLVSRRLSGSKRGAELAVIVALSMPLVFFQAFYLNVDAFGTAFLFASLNFAFLYAENGRAKHALLCGLCCGLSMGTKHIFIPYAGLVLIFLLMAGWRQKRAALLAAAVIAAAAPLTFWVCRASAATGNPAYPFPIRVDGINLPGAIGFPPVQVNPVLPTLHAAVPALSAVSLPANTPVKPVSLPRARITVNEDEGVGPCFAAFSVAALLAAIVDSLRRPRFPLVVLTGACLILGLLWWRLLPVPRFGLPVFVLVAVLCAQLESYLALLHRAVASVLLVTTVGFGMALCLAVPGHRIWNRFTSHNWSRAGYYGYPSLLDRLPTGSSILDRSVDERMGFAFAGANLSNRIVHMADPVTSTALDRIRVDYVIKEAAPDAEDAILDRYGDLVYDGVPQSIFPKVVSRWRVYRMR